MERTPNETARLLRRCEQISRENQNWFGPASAENGFPITGNAKYIVVQADDYLQTLQRVAAAEVSNEHSAYLAHAKSEVSRILALLQRECIVWGWDIIDLLWEGVEYKSDVVKDPLRTPQTAKYLQ